MVAKTPDEEVDRIYNVWLKYQQHNTARFTRALDQIGYRDVLQDLLGLCSFNPEYVRAHLPTVLNYQLRGRPRGPPVLPLPRHQGPER